MQSGIILILVVVILLLAFVVVPQWQLKRAIRQVIQIFREHNALDINNAKTVDELGLTPRSIVGIMMKGHNYKQYALNALTKAEVMQRTEDGRLYLSEERLIASGLGR